MPTGILHVITDTDRRGAQTFALDLDRALQTRGVASRTVALARGPQRGGHEVAYLGVRRLGVTTLQGLRAELRRATVALAHGSSTLPACALAGAATGVPFVYRSIGEPLYWAPTRLRRARVRGFMSRAAAVVALWPSAARDIVEQLGVPAERVSVIPNGVPAERHPPVDPARRPDARRALGLAPDVPTVAYVGSLTPEKDVPAAIEAAAGLENCQLVIAGDGPLRAEVERQAASRCPGRVRLLGRVEGPAEVFAAADAICLPSRSEGMPGVLIEAGLSGLPAVATDVGGVSEIVRDGVTGGLVPPGDVVALTQRLGDVLAHSVTYGDAARQWCLERFEIGVVASAWHTLLQQVAGSAQ